MNLIKNKIDFFLESSFRALFFLLFAFPLYPFKFQSILIILYVFLGLILYYKNIKQRIKSIGLKIFIIPLLWLFYLVLTLSYSNNISYGITQLTKSISFIVIPFMFFYVTPLSLFKSTKRVFYVFIISNILFYIIIYFDIYNVVKDNCFYELEVMPLSEKLSFLRRKNYTVLLSCYETFENSPLFIHKVYNSLNIVLLIGFLFYRIYSKSINYFIGILIILIFTCVCLFQRSVVNIFILCLILVFFSYKILGFYINKKVLIYLLGSILIFGFYFFIKQKNIDFVVKDIVPVVKIFESIKENKRVDGVNERWDLTITNAELIKKNVVFGHGIGDVQDELNKEYKLKINESKTYVKAYEEHMNSHNYYAYLFQSGGLICFLLFMIGFYYYFKKGWEYKDILYLGFLLLVLINLLFENILSRINGILFFTLFNSFFISRKLKAINKL